ncbi:hypothetical protein MWU75_04875 [Ornithinimicrobium sp. F0845]|uniref:hypothetical protein n=1 Tax=Ornithinimicrobium sp. F0845 TaxID=2926412 RepID=UPI001FF4EC45|nr:hypothetical protein [Ornithinimicrobium sp. F0845]MCK0111469.1 hypothetical protein [Ornithinimicrobium sp. F0845]
MSPADLERKVRQHDNDISAIYALIGDVQNTQVRHTTRFDELTQDVAGLGERLGSVETRMTSLEGKVDHLDTKVDHIAATVDDLQGSVNQVLDLLQQGRDG